MPPPRIVAVIGAECSGKSALSAALADALGAALVPEQLRAFVVQHGRAPGQAEQAGIMAAQGAAEDAAAEAAALVVSDSGALTTAMYSRLYFGDDSLVAPAVARHRQAALVTLWCDIDLPWVADSGQRDGADFRIRGHDLLADLLAAHPIDVVLVSGTPQQRLQVALRAIAQRR
jgi:nicotinamide riboside kinase